LYDFLKNKKFTINSYKDFKYYRRTKILDKL